MDEGEPLTAVVVDDSVYMRTSIADVLENGGIEVVASAANGREGVAAVREHGPDVVTMDVEMPEVDGLTAVERIMASNPTPILMLSSHTSDGAEVTFEALRRGAADFHPKPEAAATGIHAQDDVIVRKAREVAAADVSALAADEGPATPSADAPSPSGNPLLVVGASTGGPAVVERLLANLPFEAGFRVLVVQHMVSSFTDRFASRLDRVSAYDVGEAEHGDRISGGEALVAPGGRHLVVSGSARGRLRVTLSEESPRHGVRPAVDVTLESAAEAADDGDSLVALVLSGMGSDGAAGAGAVADAGGTVLVQDPTSAVVDGMPGAVVDAGYADAVLPRDRLVRGVVDAITENGVIEQ